MDEAPTPYMVITVKNKLTGEIEKIKESRFNPGLHIFLKDRQVNYSGGRVVNTDTLPIIGQSPSLITPVPVEAEIVEPVEIINEVVDVEPPEEVPAEETDEEVRMKAKEAGIKSWHMKSIKRLKEELNNLTQTT